MALATRSNIPHATGDDAVAASEKSEIVPDDVALELEHCLGFTSNGQGIAFYPRPDRSLVAYGCGKLLVISDLDDPHEQRLLRGHDAYVSAVDISASGSMFATGQYRSVDGFVWFNVWDYTTSQVRLRVQTPHKDVIDALRFSPDEAMIASTGAEGSVIIWDAVTGRRVGSYSDSLSGDRARSLVWGAVFNAGTRDQKYLLYVAFNTGVRMCTLSFSIKKLAFELQCSPCQLPGAGGRMGGYVRHYNCCAVVGGDLLCGTSSGDLLVFNASTGLYRTALTLCASGVTALADVPVQKCVFVGGGDGKLQKIAGGERDWKLLGQVQLEGAIVSMSVSVDEHQVVVMTTAGFLYRVLTHDMSFTVSAEAPLRGLADIALSPDRADIFVSASNDGLLRVWDLNAYSVLSTFSLSSAAASRTGAVADVASPSSCAFDPEPNRVLSGWTDGRVRCVDVSGFRGALVWTLPNGHKGRVHTIRVCSLYIVTAGDDSVVRVWSRSTKDLATQLQDHKLPTTMVHIDNTTPSILHSIGLDMRLIAYDLNKCDTNPSVKGPKRIAVHSLSGCGGFTCVTQRADHEHEMVVGTVDGRLLIYDLDYEAPVISIADQTRTRVTACEVSPNGKFLAAGLADGTLTIYAFTSTGGSDERGASNPHLRQPSPGNQQGGRAGSSGDGCRLLLQQQCHSSTVVRCSWTADGRQLVSAGGDGELILWNFYTKH